jgi:hypothetical protein
VIVIGKRINDGQGQWWVMTVYAPSQSGWRPVAEASANFIEVVDRTKDKRGVQVMICSELDHGDCDKPTAKVRFEDWYWDGRVVQRLQAATTTVTVHEVAWALFEDQMQM